jgi:DNA recombination protein RmuC
MLDEYERGNPMLAEDAARQLDTRIRQEARSIKEKYLNPPDTTDFAIMFLPVEGLYAEVLRRPGLCETLQREYRVVIAGPTTLAAILNSLQMGFRTLAIEQRSSEVWALLGAVKAEFGRFGDLLDKTHKKLEEAAATIDGASKKSRTIERRLKDVQALPVPDAVALLGELANPDSE